MSQALRDPVWPGLAAEGFTFVSLAFFALSLCSHVVEEQLLRRRRPSQVLSEARSKLP